MQSKWTCPRCSRTLLANLSGIRAHLAADCDSAADVECTGTTDEFPAGVFADFPADYRDTIDAYYPVAVAIESIALPTNPAEQVDTAALMVDLMREVYTGTQFDAALSVMGGPYGNPEVRR